ncbi:DUF433 domain-containing protein [Candidatus Viridilinea mediisalina]|uniref:DUF433 domain-containing protein n=1 Tax=Candidatus Viridilinea mediisalina TaxID=2024553 RepID=A0A2A6RPT0_9CHLR|nr:DUF433 domain-containing protein [Candidatus Viridilinea mediisalina]PDW04936.1 hypothetical protein CJ255_00730 [Candidatus Viridilinea mediisalina]
MERNWSDLAAVEAHPDVVSGTWVFRGTRVPVVALFENLRDGATIDQFLEWFPGVQRADVEAVLDYEVALLNLPVERAALGTYEELEI